MNRRAAYRYGLRAEFFCRLWLRAKFYQILASRYLSPYGEMDIIAERFGSLAFIEVKARQDADAGLHAITAGKQRHLAQTAEHWLAQHPRYAAHKVRFDVMLCRPKRLPRHMVDCWRP